MCPAASLPHGLPCVPQVAQDNGWCMLLRTHSLMSLSNRKRPKDDAYWAKKPLTWTTNLQVNLQAGPRHFHPAGATLRGPAHRPPWLLCKQKNP